MMAAALSYRVLFSLLPLIVLAAAVAQYAIPKAQFRASMHDLINRVGLDDMSLHHHDASHGISDLGSWLDGLIDQAASFDLSGLTWIGIVLLAWAAYRLFAEVEASLSVIADGTRRQKLWIRLVTWLVLLVIGPALATWGLTILGELADELDALGIRTLATIGNAFLSFLAVWIFVLLAFRLIPARRLSWRSVGLGALIASLMLAIGKWGLQRYIVHAVGASPIGGSLGLVPLLMLWVYVMWLCLLYGMEVAALFERASRRWRSSRP